jgi:putative ABC transport system permease protein
LPLDLREGEAAAVLQGLLRGEVVLGTAVAQRFGLRPGDSLTLDTIDGPKQLRVAGTVAEYAVGGSAMYMEWSTARDLLGLPGVHIFLVSAKAGTAAALAPKLQALCERDHLLLQSNAELRELIDRLVSRMAGVLWALMALAFVVGSLGVVNTLTMNVHDQTRQFGVLRALGLKAGQLRKVVLAQALLLGCVGLLPGAGAGVALAYLINRTTASLGPPVPFHFDGPVVFGCCGLALVIALLAALLPARKAARLPVVRALADA